MGTTFGNELGALTLVTLGVASVFAAGVDCGEATTGYTRAASGTLAVGLEYSSASSRSMSSVEAIGNFVSASTSSAVTPRLSNVELVRRLKEIRARAISNGLKLMSINEINAEVSELRGNRGVGDA